MRREGKVHGVQLQAGRRVPGSGVRGKTHRPTNQSKTTAKIIEERKSFYPVSSTDPAMLKLPFGKEKQSYKEKSFDITRNSLVPDWKVYRRGESELNAGCACGKAFCDDWKCALSRDSSQYEEEAEQETWEASSPGTEMIVSLEGILSKSKRKGGTSSKAKSTAWTQQRRGSTVLAEGGEDFSWEIAENVVDDVEEWWGIGDDEGEVVMDDWFLITQDDGFLA